MESSASGTLVGSLKPSLVIDICQLSALGLGDMAVSNTIGSNVFDILVGLGIPWGLQTMVINYGSTVSSSSLLSHMHARHALCGFGCWACASSELQGDTWSPAPQLPGFCLPRRPWNSLGRLQGEPLCAVPAPQPTGMRLSHPLCSLQGQD